MPIPENTEPKNHEKSNSHSKNGSAYILYILATAVLVTYGLFIYYLIGKVAIEDPDWSRLIYLFSGVEAIVFAAAGFLFGQEVNRKRASHAEKEKERAEREKEVAKEETVEERKNALILGAMAIQAEQTAPQDISEESSFEITSSKTAMANIAEKARRIYPELNKF